MTQTKALRLLQKYKSKLPRNTVKTIYGQIVHGDIEAAVKGIRRITDGK